MSKITISRRVVLYGDRPKHRLQAWISQTTNNIPNKLFVYQKIPFVPFEGCPDTMFSNIASYSDIVDFPVDAADNNLSPFYRLGYIDLIFESLPVLEEKWKLMRNHLQHTVEDVVRINSLQPVEIDFLDV